MPVRYIKSLKKYKVVGPSEIEKSKKNTNLADEFDFVMRAYSDGTIDDEVAIETLKALHQHYFEQED